MATNNRSSVRTNHIVLRGRVGSGMSERTLPSGDQSVSFRVIVDRGTDAAAGKSSDTIDCVAFGGAIRRKVLRLTEGVHVDLEGSLRRRFFRSGGALVSRYEVEIESLTRVQR